jgi:hypothetical protein
MFGIIGIIFDHRKLLAIITTTIAGSIVLVWLVAIALSVIYR